jgi:hypothetical protein
VGIVLVSLACFWVVEPTNFSGFDEWLTIDLASRGVVSMPYQHRPLILLFFLPGAWPPGVGLGGYWWAQWTYLTATGVLTFLLVRRLRGASAGLAFLAGVIASVWAPSDRIRLDVVLGRGYAGATAATLFVLVLFVESYRARRGLGLLLACVLAAVSGLAAEATLPLLLVGSLLPWLVEGDPRRRRLWAGALGACSLGAALLAASALRPGAEASYQSSALGLDPRPLGVVARFFRLAYEHLRPLFAGELSELASPGCLAATTVFLIAGLLVFRASRDRSSERPPSASRLALFGAVAAGAAYAAFALSPAIRTPDRTQVLSAPGVGLLLAGGAWAVAGLLLRRAQPWCVAALGAWVVAVGAGRTAALQREWRETSYWRAQNDSLVALTRLVPMTRPGTLLILIDERGAWPASFTFRHAVEHLYGGRALGFAPGEHDYFLYPGKFVREGFLCTPWAVIQKPWNEPARLHAYDQMIVARLPARGPLTLLDEWPDTALPPLPPGARYAPRRLIETPSPPPAARAILRQP